MAKDQTQTAGTFKRVLLWIVAISIVIVIIVYLAFKLSPWPSALMIRYAFETEAVKVNEALKEYVPKGISELKELQYDPNERDAKLDVYYPQSLSTDKLPVIVWVHGGGWISGNKGHLENYCKILASHNYIAISIDYSIAPGSKYPTPLKQLNAALKYLSDNADKLHINSNHFILAGDSGGAHIVSQVANIIYNQKYAEALQITPNIKPSQLSGLLLYCGPYDTREINLEGPFGGFLRTVLWSYSGSRNFLSDSIFKTASIIDYINYPYPPTFISAGNADPLLSHSKSLARKLDSKHIKVDTLFFPNNYKPALPHEYQFTLTTEAGKHALERSLSFLDNLNLRQH